MASPLSQTDHPATFENPLHHRFTALLLALLLVLGFSCGPQTLLTEPTVDAGFVEKSAPTEPTQDIESSPEPHPNEPESIPDQEPLPETTAEELPPDKTSFAQALEQFNTKYQITLLQQPSFPVKTQYGDINGKIAATADIEAYAKVFFPEWSLYPPELIKKIGLKSVAFCTDLSFAGQARTAIPDMENHILFLDIKRGFYNLLYVRRTIHHELFHFIDFYDDWKLYQDDEWAALNPKDFSYKNGGANAQGDSSGSLLTEAYPGFFTTYSLSGVEEDKAEVFSILVVLATAAKEREKKDTIIAAKIARMKQLLSRFCPQVDEAFWETAAQLPRTP